MLASGLHGTQPFPEAVSRPAGGCLALQEPGKEHPLEFTGGAADSELGSPVGLHPVLVLS